MSDSNGRHISTHEATVKTAAVYVRALMIEKHQVTLAVFRQLRNQVLVDPDTADLAGVPWGTVNYHPSAWHCPPTDEHLHVVWQHGEELRRCTVARDWPTRPWVSDLNTVVVRAQDHAVRLVLIRILEGVAPAFEDEAGYGRVFPIDVDGLPPISIVLPDRYQSVHRYSVGDGYSKYREIGTRRFGTPHSTLVEAARSMLDNIRLERNDEPCGSACDRARQVLVEELGVGASVEDETRALQECAEYYGAITRKRDTAKAAWTRQYATLEQLDQLFIAV